MEYIAARMTVAADERTHQDSLFLDVLFVGLLYVAVPSAAVGFYKRMRWPDGYWSGGMLFTNDRSTRVVGLVLVLTSLFGLHSILWG